MGLETEAGFIAFDLLIWALECLELWLLLRIFERVSVLKWLHVISVVILSLDMINFLHLFWVRFVSLRKAVNCVINGGNRSILRASLGHLTQLFKFSVRIFSGTLVRYLLLIQLLLLWCATILLFLIVNFLVWDLFGNGFSVNIARI